MEKHFDQWNLVKKKLHAESNKSGIFFHEREIWWCAIGVNIGVESDGKNHHFERPVLIIRKFNGHMLWAVPMTSRERTEAHFYSIQHDRGVSFACLSQLKTISSKRLLRKIGMIGADEFQVVQEKISDYIKNRTPR